MKHEKKDNPVMGKKGKEHGGFGKKMPGFSSKVGKGAKGFGKNMASPAK